MAKTSKSAWTGRERWIAAAWSAAIEGKALRNPLSGANNKTDDGEPRVGDVILPKGYSVVIESKLRAAFAHHTEFKNVQKDAMKVNKAHSILYTFRKHETGGLVTISTDLFHQLLAIPAVQEILQNGGPREPDIAPRTRRRTPRGTAKRPSKSRAAAARAAQAAGHDPESEPGPT